MEKIEQLFKNFQNKLDKFKLMADYFNVLSYYADYLDDQEYQRFENLKEQRIFGVSSERLFGHNQFDAETWLLNNLFISLFTETDGLIIDLFTDLSLSSNNEILSTFFTTNYKKYLIKVRSKFDKDQPNPKICIRYIFEGNIQKISEIEANDQHWVDYNFIYRPHRNSFVHLSFLEGQKAKKDYWSKIAKEVDESLNLLVKDGLASSSIQNNYKKYKDSCTKDFLVTLHSNIVDFIELLQSLLTEMSNGNIEYEKY